MEKESPESLRIFLPSVFVAMSLLVFFTNEIKRELYELKSLTFAYQKNHEQLEHRGRINSQLEKVARSLYQAAKTNETAALLIRKHKILLAEDSPARNTP